LNWITNSWLMIGGMSLALGLVQLFVWLQRREGREHLVYGLFALGAAAGSVSELMMMSARTTADFAHALRLTHFGFGTALLCMPWFVRVRFGAGNRYLLYSATALRALVLAVSIFSAMTINLADIQLQQVVLPGGVHATVPVGRFNPWVIPAHLSLLLLLGYLVDALLELRRRGEKEEFRRGLRTCGSMIAFVLISGGQTILVTYGFVQMPYLITPMFLLPILVLGFDLGTDVLRAQAASDRLGLSESRLRASEERWELAGQIAGIAPWSWDAASGELRLSNRARQMFGITAEGPARIEDWTQRIHPEDAERVRADVARTMATQNSFERDYRTIMPDGSVRWITSRGSVERDAAGAIRSMYGVSFDLTQIREADAKFRAVLEAAPNAIFLVDEDGMIRLVNARACLLFGYTFTELEQLRLDELIPEWRHQPELRKHAAEDVEPERRSGRRELLALRRGGVAFPAEVELRPFERGHLLVSVSDISERRQAEQESAQQRTELAHLSRVAVLGEMSASLAHELNQPLTAIVSNAHAAVRFLAAGAQHHAELQETLQDIAASGNRAGDVIRRLRALLKKEEAQRLPLDVNQLITEVLQLYRSDLINRGVSVRLDLDPALPAVLGDRVQLQQVLLNLVINACDAMAEVAGDRRLCVCTKRRPGNEVEFAVCDVGPGIAPERLEQVFEPFVSTKSSGMCLGLSVC
jgi:two-component system sensor kinase FixL